MALPWPFLPFLPYFAFAFALADGPRRCAARLDHSRAAESIPRSVRHFADEDACILFDNCLPLCK
jgi:hypothetical protein